MWNKKIRAGRRGLLFLAIVVIVNLFSGSANAWWNDEWPYRTPIIIDASITGANLAESNSNFTALIKLHTGNFSDFFLLNENLSDLRFVAGDDKTPLKHHVEYVDLINQFLYVWVKVPTVSAGINTERLWMYYGNQTAVSSDDIAGSYDVNTALVYHFNVGETIPSDATAYRANATEFTAQISPQSLIGAGANFSGDGRAFIPDLPSFAVNADSGLTISFWLEPAGRQENAWVLERSDGNRSLVIGVNGPNIFASLETAGGETYVTPDATVITDDTWQHVALVLSAERMTLYVDGEEVAYTPITLEPLTGAWSLGNAMAGGRGYQGELDEFRIDNIARNHSWIKAAVATQGVDSLLLIPQPSEQLGSGGETGILNVLLTSTGQSGWTIIILLALMAAVSWMVMFGKLFYISRVVKDNHGFIEEYKKIRGGDPTQLDQVQTNREEEMEDSPIAQALFGKHDHFQSSPIYRLYHRGVQEVQSRVGSTVGAQAAGFKDQAFDAIKAALDAQMIREVQRLNSQMVLLTIAISGGPFLGLLGTVLGVMITFGAIALTGDVNIGAIAPGVAAALLTTVAGLIVAIPALFGYNYLATRIKEAIADMRVFSDEFVTRIAEYYAR